MRFGLLGAVTRGVRRYVIFSELNFVVPTLVKKSGPDKILVYGTCRCRRRQRPLSSAARAPGRDPPGRSRLLSSVLSLSLGPPSPLQSRFHPGAPKGRHTSSARTLRRGASPRAVGQRCRQRRRCCFLPSAACTQSALGALITQSWVSTLTHWDLHGFAQFDLSETTTTGGCPAAGGAPTCPLLFLISAPGWFSYLF